MEINVIKVIGNAANFGVKVNSIVYPVSVPIANMPRRYKGVKFNYSYADSWNEEETDLVVNWMQNWVDREAVLKYIDTIVGKEKTCGVISSLGYNIRIPSKVVGAIIKDLFDGINEKDILKHGKLLFDSAKKTLDRKQKEIEKKCPAFRLKICGKYFTLNIKYFRKDNFTSKNDARKHYQNLADSCVIKYAGYGDVLFSLGYKLYQEGPTVQKIYEFLKEIPESKINDSAKMLIKEKKQNGDAKRKVRSKKNAPECVINGEVEFLLNRLRNDIVRGNKVKTAVYMAGIHVGTYERLDEIGIKYEIGKWTTHLFAPEKDSKAWKLLFNEATKELNVECDEIEILKDILVNGTKEEKATLHALIEKHNEKAKERKRIEDEIAKLKERLKTL